MPSHRKPAGWVTLSKRESSTRNVTVFPSVDLADIASVLKAQPEVIHEYLTADARSDAQSRLAFKLIDDCLHIRHTGHVGQLEDDLRFRTIRRYYFREARVYAVYLESRGTDSGIVTWRRSVFRRWLDIYDHLAVSRIDLEANIDLGGYNWARAGFRPMDIAELEKVRKHVQSRWEMLSPVLRRSLSSLQFQAWSEAIALKSSEALGVVAELHYPQQVSPADFSASEFPGNRGGNRSVGLSLLRDSHWWGSLQLDSAEAYLTYKAYLERSQKR
jgi:hypothetical protein